MRVLMLLLLFSFASAQEPESRILETVFSPGDLEALETLVTTAQESSPEVLEATRASLLAASEIEPLGRLSRALDVRASGSVAGSPYTQASPSYSISVSLDVVGLLDVPDEREVVARRLTRASAQTRVEVVQAFTAYIVAHNAAESAAQALEAAETQFRVTTSRLEVQEATLGDQITARSAVGSAAVSLLSANAEVIVTLEQLAAVVGLTAEDVLELIGGGEQE